MKKSFKKFLALSLVAAFSLALTACSSGTATEEVADGEWVFENNIEIICPWGTGGGADTTVRTFATALEEVLDVSVTVNNKSGAGGVTGTQFFTQQPADGYTYLMLTPSPVLAQISGATDFDVYGSVKPLVQMVHDINILITSKDAPYNNYAELMDYVNANPGEVKAGVMTVTGLDGACVQAAFGDSIEAVGYTEGSQLNADVMGGHVALAVVGPAEVSALVESGDVKVVMTFTEESVTLPGFDNVQSAGEAGVEAYYGPARGIFYAEGTPEAAVKAFEAAAEQAIASATFQDWATSQGLDQRQGYLNTADYTAAWDADYAALTELFGN